MGCVRFAKTLFAAVGLVRGYRFIASGKELCGCRNFGTDLRVLADCVRDAVARPDCVQPDYGVRARIREGESCTEARGNVVLITHPKINMHILSSLRLDRNLACRTFSIQLGNVPSDSTVQNGPVCATFTKTRELRFSDDPDDFSFPVFHLGLTDAAEGNALRVVGDARCVYDTSTARIYHSYGLLD